VLSRLPGARVTFVAEQAGPVQTDTRQLTLLAESTLDEVSAPELVLVPGGPGQESLMQNGPVHEWLRGVDAKSTWTASVCTGSLILAAAGLLVGRRATSNWQALEQLRELGATVAKERVAIDGKYATSAGVSAGIDLALRLAAEIAGERVAQAIQLGIEYDPQPPFDAGSPEKAPAELVEAVRAYSRFESEQAQASAP